MGFTGGRRTGSGWRGALSAALCAGTLLVAPPARASETPLPDRGATAPAAVSRPQAVPAPRAPGHAVTFEAALLLALKLTGEPVRDSVETVLVEAQGWVPARPLILPPATGPESDLPVGLAAVADPGAAPYDRVRLYVELARLAGFVSYVGASVGLLRDPLTPTHAAVQYDDWFTVGPVAGLVYAF